jgi:hypothetical protein
MTEKDVLFVMTICKLMGKTPNTKEVKDAYKWALHELEKLPL